MGTMPKISISYYKSPIGEIILGSFDGKLCLADWRYRKMRTSIDSRIKTGLNADFFEESSEITKLAEIQLSEYFQKKRKKFDIPLLFVGTEFQKKVWQSLLTVEYGKTLSYLGLSELLGNKKAIRAVATANGANAISIIVPCHRIIGSDGKLVGYAGGLAGKQKLLELENSQNQINLFPSFKK